MRFQLSAFLLLGMCVLLACTSAPPTPSAEQYFADAKSNLRTMDYGAALKNLDRLIKSAGEQPLGQQGITLRVLLQTAMAEAYKQMADAYALGAKQPPAQVRPAVFSKMRADYNGMARVRLMNALEGVMGQRSKLTEQPIPLDVTFPEFGGTDPAALGKIKSGYQAEDADRYRAELESVRNALARRLAGVAGLGENLHKGRTKFEKGGAQLDTRLYLIEMSDSFLRLSEIFGPRGIDDPRYRRAALEVVRDTLDVALKLLAARPDKDLEARAKKLRAECEKQLKSLPV